ncbi:MAG TPA: glycosyltransferase, partial [Pyrinomonadaceae bacterium]|nr:glycosyltransferase [Pyrinomonadaceae bacterium]
NLPGELIERPWIDFAHNRSEALEFARGKSDYVFVIDADELLVQDQDFKLPQLTHDAYYVKISSAPLTFWRPQLFRNMAGWRYESAVHEYLAGPETFTFERLHGLWIDSRTDGWRAAQPGVYERDVEQLLREYKKTPNDPRTAFHLGQSYAAAGELELAIEYFQRCVEIGGWPEEVWLALFQIAETKERLQRAWPEVLAAYLDAYQYRPSRAEPLYRIAVHYRWSNEFHLAHMFLKQAAEIPYPVNEISFVEERLYRYVIKMALATCCYQIGQYDAGIRYCDELLQDRSSMPPNIYEQILINRQQCAAKAAEAYAKSAEQRPKIKAVIAFRDGGHHLDNCIERLLNQSCTPLEIVFLDLGSTDGSDRKVPIEDPRVSLLRSEGEDIWSFVATHCDEDDVVFLLNGHDWLASEDALADLQQRFADPGCLVTYGQFQYADGTLGVACAISNVNSDDLFIDDWRCTYPLAFRAGLLKQIVREDTTLVTRGDPPAIAGGTDLIQDKDLSRKDHVALARKLFAAAGPNGIRFNPIPICVHDADRTPVNGFHAPAISKQTQPKISCLTVTLNRLVLLKEAIQCYCRQTYQNRELIIVTDGTPRYRQAIDDYLSSLGRSDIQLVYVDEPGQSLGALRNISLDSASGDIVCQWDDDDLNHPQRLKRQFDHLNAARANACCFTDQLQFFVHERKLYWSDWRIDEPTPNAHLIPGTLMSHHDTRFRYPLASAGEDSGLLNHIMKTGTVVPFEDAGFLNIYSYHGRNVFPEIHHRRITLRSSRPVDFLRSQERTLRDALRHYRLPEPYRFTTGNGLVMFIQE